MKIKFYVMTLILLTSLMVACDSSSKKEKGTDETADMQSLSPDAKASQAPVGIRDMPAEEIALETLVPAEAILEVLEAPILEEIKQKVNKDGELVISYPNIHRPNELAHLTISKGAAFSGDMEAIRAMGTGENKMFYDGIGELGGYYEAGEVNQFIFPLKGFLYHMTMPEFLPMDLKAEKGRLLALKLWEIHEYRRPM